MSGRDPDSGGIYGRKSEGFPYVYENPVHPSDPLQERLPLFAVSAYYRQEKRSGRTEASPGPEKSGIDGAYGA